MPNDPNVWPELDYAAAQPTLDTLQRWMQMVGKLRLALTPWLNHSWHVPLYVTARGLGTSAVPFGAELLEAEFDFTAHRLTLATSRGDTATIALEPKSVAAFHCELLSALERLGVDATIAPTPNEMPDAIPFATDEIHRDYDPTHAHAVWRALVAAHRILSRFRTGFLGKASPVHVFWGGFDLAVTRFSGRTAPPHPGGIPNLSDAVTREAYSHEVSSAGFWPGDARYPHAAFYSYAYPVPAGFNAATVRGGEWLPALGEWVLPWTRVCSSLNPEVTVMAFLEDTYAAAADLAHWNRAALECDLGVPGRPRPV